MGISVIVHTYNSEKTLEKCLESVKSCQEIIVCDMHSTDRTIEIAYRYGAKVIYHKNVGIADPARNYAVSYASQDWILVLDSDEQVPPELMEYLVNLKKDIPKNKSAVFIPRKNLYLNEVLWVLYPDYVLRFFKNGSVIFSEELHALPTIKKGEAYYIKKKRKDLAIIHYRYDSIGQWLSKMNKYTTLEMEKLREKGVKFSAGLLFIAPFFEFIKCYIFKGGFKTGWHGFNFSALMGFYKFIVAIKLWEKGFKG